MAGGLTLDVVDVPLAISRLAAETPIPEWVWRAKHFLTISRTSQELSITCDADVVPREVPSQRDYRAFRVRGTLGFGLVGLIASIVQPLAEAGISTLNISTHDTDFLLVKLEDAEHARSALERAGHHVV
ncbi:MAG TPA: ACT domain-containing protein [Gemmatimonadales bacterium]|jgi:hypothetical protein